MGLDFEKRELTGSVRDLVNTGADSDARLGFVTDKVSGAKVAMNISGAEDALESDEPFYIESPDGENLYDAYNRREAVRILTNIRSGDPYPDLHHTEPRPRRRKPVTKRARRARESPPVVVSRVR